MIQNGSTARTAEPLPPVQTNRAKADAIVRPITSQAKRSRDLMLAADCLTEPVSASRKPGATGGDGRWLRVGRLRGEGPVIETSSCVARSRRRPGFRGPA